MFRTGESLNSSTLPAGGCRRKRLHRESLESVTLVIIMIFRHGVVSIPSGNFSPLAPTRAHLRQASSRSQPLGGLGRGRVCSIDRRQSTNLTERIRTPSWNGTPHRVSLRRVPPSRLSDLSLFLSFSSLRYFDRRAPLLFSFHIFTLPFNRSSSFLFLFGTNFLSRRSLAPRQRAEF